MWPRVMAIRLLASGLFLWLAIGVAHSDNPASKPPEEPAASKAATFSPAIEKLLASDHLRLNMEIKTLRSGIEWEHEVEVFELYTNWASDKRAMVEIRPQQEPSSANMKFYRVEQLHREPVLLQTQSNGHSGDLNCQKATITDLYDKLLGPLSADDHNVVGDDFLYMDKRIPEYIIGPFRLFLLVDLMRDKILKIEGNQMVFNSRQTIRWAQITLGSLTDIRVWASYFTGMGENTLPVRITLYMPNENTVQVSLKTSDVFMDEHVSSEWFGEPVEYGLSLPIGAGCSQFLSPSNLMNRLLWFETFSFRAIVRDSVDVGSNDGARGGQQTNELKREEMLFVAYDDMQQVSRIDREGEELIDGKKQSYYTSTIVNIQTGKRHYILERANQEPICLTAEISEPTGSIYKEMLMLNGLIYMGRGQVRDVPVLIFEQIRNTLPVCLFAPVDVRKNSDLVSQYSGESAYEPDSYTIVYYFASSNQLDTNPGPLMRMSIFSKKQGRKLFDIELFEFVWRLSEAPNGDQPVDLFALHDRCRNEFKVNDRSATLHIDLRYSKSPKKISFDIEDVVRMLHDPASRNNAIIRGLLFRSQDLAGKIQTSRSKLRVVPAAKPEDTSWLSISIALDLIDLRWSRTYEAVKVMSANLVDTSGVRGAISFGDCFWQAARERAAGSRVIFSYCKNICSIDTDPEISIVGYDDTIVVGSKLYDRIKDGGACDIFEMTTLEPKYFMPTKNSWQAIYNQLVGQRQIFALAFDTSGENPKRSIPLHIDRVELTNDHWTSGPRGETSLQEAELFEGLSFVKTEPGIRELEMETSLSHQDFNVETCREGCQANIECNSFSTCVRAGRIECLMSGVDLSSTDAKVELRTRGKPAKYLNSKEVTLKLAVRLADELNQGEQKVEKISVKLIVDRRCQLHNKNPLDVFHRTKDVKVALVSRKLIPVESEQECAKKCLQYMGLFFKLSRDIEFISDRSDRILHLRYKLAKLGKVWCDKFRFARLDTSSESKQVKKFLDSQHLSKASAICILTMPNWSLTKQINQQNGQQVQPVKDKPPARLSIDEKPSLMMETFQFHYASLYKRESNYRLSAPGEQDLSSDETNTHDDHQDASKKIDQTHETSQQLTNLQASLKVEDADECARYCFARVVGKKFWCRSFDIIETFKPYKAPTINCLLNSLSLEQARKAANSINLVIQEEPIRLDSDDFQSSTRRVWHYEPKQAYYLGEEAILDQLIASDARNRVEYSNQNYLWQDLPAYLLVSCLGCISGLVIGFKSAPSVISSRGRERARSLQSNLIMDMTPRDTLTGQQGTSDIHELDSTANWQS